MQGHHLIAAQLIEDTGFIQRQRIAQWLRAEDRPTDGIKAGMSGLDLSRLHSGL